jgi:phage repressor protein C with HTH and peptisase S24 domain
MPYFLYVGLPNMQSTLGERVKMVLAGPPKITQKALAEACGISPVSVNDWVHDRTQTIEGSNLLKAAQFLRVNARWLAEGVGPMRADLIDTDSSGRTHLPDGARAVTLKSAYRVGIVQGGNNGYFEDYAPAVQEPEAVYYASTLIDEQAYAVKVRGSSMEPAIMAGWDVIASPCRPAEPPDLCAVYFTDGRKAFKRLAWVRNGMVCLESISTLYEKITEPVENITRMDKVISIVPN